MSREVHVQFCESLGVKVPGATLPLFSCQPLAEAVLATGADFLFVCKKDGHKTLYVALGKARKRGN
jgi:hypothetical protein